MSAGLIANFLSSVAQTAATEIVDGCDQRLRACWAANSPGVDVALEESRMKCGWSAYPSAAATSASVAC